MGRVIAIGADTTGVGWRRADRTRAPFEQTDAELPSGLRCAEPRTDIVYCYTVCRLELVVDPETLKLGLAPLPENT